MNGNREPGYGTKRTYAGKRNESSLGMGCVPTDEKQNFNHTRRENKPDSVSETSYPQSFADAQTRFLSSYQAACLGMDPNEDEKRKRTGKKVLPPPGAAQALPAENGIGLLREGAPGGSDAGRGWYGNPEATSSLQTSTTKVFTPSSSPNAGHDASFSQLLQWEEAHVDEDGNLILSEEDINDSYRYLTALEAAELDMVDEWVEEMAALEEEEENEIIEYSLRQVHSIYGTAGRAARDAQSDSAAEEGGWIKVEAHHSH